MRPLGGGLGGMRGFRGMNNSLAVALHFVTSPDGGPLRTILYVLMSSLGFLLLYGSLLYNSALLNRKMGIVVANVESAKSRMVELTTSVQAMQATMETVGTHMETIKNQGLMQIDQMNLLSNGIRLANIHSATFGNVYLGDGMVSCYVAPLGIWMMLESLDKGITPHLCHGYGWEPATTVAFERILKPGMWVIDIGSNIGWFTALAFKLVGDKGRIISVEAQPRTFDLLMTTLELNGMLGVVKPINRAVYSRQDVYVDIRYYPERTLSNHVIPDGQAIEVDAGIHHIQTVTLHQLVIDAKWDHVDFIKIDVQGDEALLWEGIGNVIEKNPNIIILMETNIFRLEVFKEEHSKMFIKSLARTFRSLRYIADNGNIEDLSVHDLEHKNRDYMLYLSNA